MNKKVNVICHNDSYKLVAETVERVMALSIDQQKYVLGIATGLGFNHKEGEKNGVH